MSDADLMLALYRRDIVYFAERAMVILEPQTELQTNWHHRAIACKLDLCYRGEIRRLIINQPPKTLKTHLVSVAYVAWLLAQDPALKIAILCYDEQLASKQLRAIRQIMVDPWYGAVAPNTHIKPDKNTETLFETTGGGECRALSVQGGITGLGFDFIIIDDPMKAGLAHSETERRRLEEVYASAIANRWRNPTKGVLIVVMQRLHVDDFSMFLLRARKDTVHLNIPAIAPMDLNYDIGGGKQHIFKAGNLLEPERLSPEFLEEMRALQGTANYEAQYLQDPQAAAGRVINPDWLRYFDAARKPDYTIISIDPAFTLDGGDYSAAVIANLINDDVEIIHAEQRQFDYPALIQWIVALDKRWNPDVILIEAIGAGQGLRPYLRERGLMHVESVVTTDGKSKIERMEMISPQIESGRLWLPKSAEWLSEFRKILTDFPYGSSDDWPDALSQMLIHLKRLRQAAQVHRRRRFPPSPPPELVPHRRHSMYYRREEWT